MTITCRTAVLLMAASLSLAACGDDDDDETSTSTGGGAEPARAEEPQKVAITATGDPKAPKLEVTPAEARPGAVTIEVDNQLKKAKIDGQLLFLAEERDDPEIVAELQKAMEGKPVADWFQGAGGPSRTEAGTTASVTQELQAGTYVVVGGDGKPRLPLARLEVAGDAGPAFEPPAAVIEAKEYAFEGRGVKAGEPVLLANRGTQWHHFIAAKMKDGATIAQVKRFLRDEKGKPPFAEETGIESTVLDGGASQVVDAPAAAGRYAFFCFISDRQGGAPHVVKGMISEVEVE